MSVTDAAHMKEVAMVVSKILQLFKRYETHATWASVGLLNFDSISALKKHVLGKQIPYQNNIYNPFPLTDIKYGTFQPELLLGQSELKLIKTTPHQELASHTYSHFYSCEKGVTAKSFEEDCTTMQELFGDLKSIVFPRNQINPECLAVASKFGYKAYRGNQENRFWKNSSFKEESIFKKMGRVIDAYAKISKTQYYKTSTLSSNNELLNIPANRFLRPYSGKRWLEIRKVKLIKKEMLKAARNGEIYHLWWHPHNFSKHLTLHLNQLEELLAYANVLKDKYDFQPMNLSEIAAYAEK